MSSDAARASDAKSAPADREPLAGQSARFRIKVDRLGRVVPEIILVDEESAPEADAGEPAPTR